MFVGRMISRVFLSVIRVESISKMHSNWRVMFDWAWMSIYMIYYISSISRILTSCWTLWMNNEKCIYELIVELLIVNCWLRNW